VCNQSPSTLLLNPFSIATLSLRRVHAAKTLFALLQYWKTGKRTALYPLPCSTTAYFVKVKSALAPPDTITGLD
jgi:hypothetical protein